MQRAHLDILVLGTQAGLIDKVWPGFVHEEEREHDSHNPETAVDKLGAKTRCKQTYSNRVQSFSLQQKRHIMGSV